MNAGGGDAMDAEQAGSGGLTQDQIM